MGPVRWFFAVFYGVTGIPWVDSQSPEIVDACRDPIVSYQQVHAHPMPPGSTDSLDGALRMQFERCAASARAEIAREKARPAQQERMREERQKADERTRQARLAATQAEQERAAAEYEEQKRVDERHNRALKDAKTVQRMMSGVLCRNSAVRAQASAEISTRCKRSSANLTKTVRLRARRSRTSSVRR
jgi:hypothetical protein